MRITLEIDEHERPELIDGEQQSKPLSPMVCSILQEIRDRISERQCGGDTGRGEDEFLKELRGLTLVKWVRE